MIAAFSLKDGHSTQLALEGTQALGVVDGHLIYSRRDGFLMAAPFDMRGLRITGPAIQLNERVMAGPPGTAVTLSESGMLVFAPAALALSRLMLAASAGDAKPLGNGVRAFDTPRFSPNGMRVAAAIAEPDGSKDLWVFDLGSAEPTRVTRGEQAVLCGCAFSDNSDVYVRSLVGAGIAQVSDAGGRLPVWSHDARRLFYQAPTGTIAATLDIGTDVKVPTCVPVTAIPLTDTVVDASPDGKTLLIQASVGQGPRGFVAVNWADAVRRELLKKRGQ